MFLWYSPNFLVLFYYAAKKNYQKKEKKTFNEKQIITCY